MGDEEAAVTAFVNGHFSDLRGDHAVGFPKFVGGHGGVSVQPVRFLVVGHDQMHLLPVDANPVFDRLIDMAPALMEKLQDMFKGEADD